MATEMKSKGTVFKWTISSVLTAVPLIESISLSGAGTRTNEIITLDGPVGVRHIPDGFANVSKIAIKLLFDIANAVHLALQTASETPGAVACTITYTDAGPVTRTYSAASVGLDVNVDSSKPVMGTINIQTSGLPS